MRNVQSVVFLTILGPWIQNLILCYRLNASWVKISEQEKKNKLIWVYHLSTYQKGYKSYPVDVFKIPEVVEISEGH